MSRKATIVITFLVLMMGGLITATMMAAVAYTAWRVAYEVKRSSYESQQELSQTIGIALYNISLCALLNNTIQPRNWTLVVYNAGNKRMVIDHVAVELDGEKVREWGNEYLLLPGHYKRYELSGTCINQECAMLKVHVHTDDGVYSVGVYSTPDPYQLIMMKGGKCHEP